MRTNLKSISYFRTSEGKKEIQNISLYELMLWRSNNKISPLIREQFDRRDQFAIAHPKRIKESALARKLSELAEAAGIRTRVQLKEGQQPASIRNDVPRTNGFRRFYCGTLADSGLLTERRWLTRRTCPEG